MKKKILVAEDEKDVVFVIRTALEKDYEIVEAFDGKQALEKAKKEPPNLIILDIMMPEIDGYTVNQKLKEDEKTKDIPVIIITGKGHVRQFFEDKKKAKIDGYLEKPFSLKMLVKSIEKIIK